MARATEAVNPSSSIRVGPPPPPRRGFVILTSITVAIGGFLFGYDTAVISGAILFVRSQFHLGPVQTEVTVSIVLAGALAGCAVGGYLGDRYGRRPTLLMTALVYGIFALTTGLANGPAGLCVIASLCRRRRRHQLDAGPALYCRTGAGEYSRSPGDPQSDGDFDRRGDCVLRRLFACRVGQLALDVHQCSGALASFC